MAFAEYGPFANSKPAPVCLDRSLIAFGRSVQCLAVVRPLADARDVRLSVHVEGEQRIVRRYRAAPSPLVRDHRGLRSGRLDRVLAGDFDVMR